MAQACHTGCVASSAARGATRGRGPAAVLPSGHHAHPGSANVPTARFGRVRGAESDMICNLAAAGAGRHAGLTRRRACGPWLQRSDALENEVRADYARLCLGYCTACGGMSRGSPASDRNEWTCTSLCAREGLEGREKGRQRKSEKTLVLQTAKTLPAISSPALSPHRSGDTAATAASLEPPTVCLQPGLEGVLRTLEQRHGAAARECSVEGDW